ncbi:hypothetical protein H5410_060527 [Solanum commersonii]|uniref:Uncharacterized protein n=1 Tax=Solanum commersonii TaxID=4109 RepID=A0A9J5W5N6_SOLCO|nr:hypothetical protein H5410_060527 [Solanum commersonii]
MMRSPPVTMLGDGHNRRGKGSITSQSRKMLNTFWGEMDETADELESQMVVSNNRGLSIQTKFDWFWIRALGLPLQL